MDSDLCVSFSDTDLMLKIGGKFNGNFLNCQKILFFFHKNLIKSRGKKQLGVGGWELFFLFNCQLSTVN
jgi:hypothetical protein